MTQQPTQIQRIRRIVAQVRPAEGVLRAHQVRAISILLRRYPTLSVTVTSRQALQLSVLAGEDWAEVVQVIHTVLAESIPSRGDRARNVLCALNPKLGRLEAEI